MKLSSIKRSSIILGVGLAVVAIVLWFLPEQVDSAMLHSLILVATFCLAVTSLNIVAGYCGQLSLGQTGFMAIGAYSTAIGTVKWGWSPIVSMAAGIALTIVVAVLLGLVVFRLSGLYFAIATLGFALAVESGLQGAQPLTGGSSGIIGIPTFVVGPFDFSAPEDQFRLAAVLAVIALLFTRQLLRSRAGLAMKAVAVDERIASSFGANPLGIKLRAFVAAAIIASVAGSIYAHGLTIVVPELFNIDFAVRIVVMSFLGGANALLGPVVGSGMELTREFYANAKELIGIIEGVILALIMLFMPRGIVGSLSMVWNRALNRFRGTGPDGPKGLLGAFSRDGDGPANPVADHGGVDPLDNPATPNFEEKRHV